MLKSKQIKNLLVCFLSCFLLVSSSIVSIIAKDNGNEPYSRFNAMLTRLFNGNTTNITVQKNGVNITDYFIDENITLFETNQFNLIIDFIADNEITFTESAILVPYGIQTPTYISDYYYGVAISGTEIKLPFIYRICITASYNDQTGLVSGTPRITVLAEIDGVGDTIQVSDIQHNAAIINGGYDVRVTSVSFVLQAYGSGNEWGVWQSYDRYTWMDYISYSPAGL